MKRSITVALLAALVAVGITGSVALATAQRVEWKSMIGIIQAGNVVGSGTGAVTGGGQPWSATRGEARVDLDTGDIRFRVEGLVLAGGNSVGTNPAAEARGTLVCDTNGSAGGGNSTLLNTPLVPFSPQGDAEFKGNVGPLPAACVNEPDIAFLVRIPDRWVANGAVRIP